MKQIDNIEQWNLLAGELAEAGYTVYQTQFWWNEPDGYHAWFWHRQRPQIEIVTHDEAVQRAIIGFKPEK